MVHVVIVDVHGVEYTGIIPTRSSKPKDHGTPTTSNADNEFFIFCF